MSNDLPRPELSDADHPDDDAGLYVISVAA